MTVLAILYLVGVALWGIGSVIKYDRGAEPGPVLTLLVFGSILVGVALAITALA